MRALFRGYTSPPTSRNLAMLDHGFLMEMLRNRTLLGLTGQNPIIPFLKYILHIISSYGALGSFITAMTNPHYN